MNFSRTHAGFSLIEVMVALMVTTIGLLGLASLQLISLKTQHNAFMRGQAIQLNHDIIERMRGNCAVALAGGYNLAYTTNPTASATVAQVDMREWRQRVALLPDGRGAIAVNAATHIATVSVQWDDARGDQGVENAPDVAGQPARLEFSQSTRLCTQ